MTHAAAIAGSLAASSGAESEATLGVVLLITAALILLGAAAGLMARSGR